MSDAPGLAGVTRRWGPDTVSVVLAEEAPLLRRQLLLALESHPRINVVAEAADTETLGAEVAAEHPDAVVVSGHLPPQGPGAATVTIRRAAPGAAIVVVAPEGEGAGALPLPGVVHLSLADAVAQVAEATVALVDRRKGSATP